MLHGFAPNGPRESNSPVLVLQTLTGEAARPEFTDGQLVDASWPSLLLVCITSLSLKNIWRDFNRKSASHLTGIIADLHD
jgi:hypothetical protein